MPDRTGGHRRKERGFASLSNKGLMPVAWRTSGGRHEDILLLWSSLLHVVARTLRLDPRGGIRGDRLHVTSVSGQLEVEWQARDLHPWDRRLPFDCQNEVFVEQTLADTERALAKLFGAFPEIAVSIRVLAPGGSQRIIVTGTALRADLVAASSIHSRRMRLATLGLHFDPVASTRCRPPAELDPAPSSTG